MPTVDGKSLGVLSTMPDSDWIAPEAMFTEMAPATAAAAIGEGLTVDSTFACELAAPGRSAEPAMAMTHDRCNHMGSDPGAQGWRCERRGRQFAPLRRSSTV